jgi:hypothetical protein
MLGACVALAFRFTLSRMLQLVPDCAVQNKSLSDDTDPILAAQGVSWTKRTAISYATITVDIKHYTTPEDGFEHIDSAQTLTGGIKGQCY